MSLKENRCTEVVSRKGQVTVCNALLFKGDISSGAIQIKCTGCGKIKEFKAREPRKRITYKPAL